MVNVAGWVLIIVVVIAVVRAVMRARQGQLSWFRIAVLPVTLIAIYLVYRFIGPSSAPLPRPVIFAAFTALTLGYLWGFKTGRL